MVVSVGSSTTSESALEKIEKLREFMRGTSKSASKVGDAAGRSPQSMQIAEALFSRAPSDYIESSSLEALARVAEEANTFYQAFLESKQEFAVEVRSTEHPTDKRPVTVLLTAMSDRPFIVDTLTELLRVKQLKHHALLHPILKNEPGRLTSLTYFEIDPLENAAAVADLKTEIERRFADLLIISSDFRLMLDEIEKVSGELLETSSNGVSSQNERRELAHFLRWLADGGFVFLGTKQWIAQPGSTVVSPVPGSERGVFRSKNGAISAELLDVESNLQHQLGESGIFRHAKLVAESPIHRYGRMELVSLKLPTAAGDQRFVAFVGLLTSKALAQETSTVPIIRLKLQQILEIEGLVPHSHDYKEIISIVDSLPKTELLQYPVDTLRRDISMVFSIQGRSELKTRYSLDPLKHLISILIALPRERYWPGARTKIMHAMEALFHSHNASGEFHTTTTDYPLYVLHILLPNPGRSDLAVTAEDIEKTVLDIVLTWEDKVAKAAQEGRDKLPSRTIAHYTRVVPDSYKATVSVPEAVTDVRILDSLTPENSLELTLEPASALIVDVYDLKLYKQGADLTISAILPFLENCGFSIVHETVTPLISRSGLGAAIYKLRVKPKSGRAVDLERARAILLPGLKLVLASKAVNDRLNELMLFPGIDYREVAILRVITHYLWQIKATTSDQAVVSAIVENPSVAAKLVEIFRTKFDPALFPDDPSARARRMEELREELLIELKGVAQLLHDRTLRRLMNVVDATVRTNFFRPGTETRIALKIDCKRIERMPDPRPYFEIFINAPDFEGVHLRGGKVARGGLRWSDREDDFRTEVLGLMKTQMVKNSIIIPVGAKGGFVLKNRPSTPAELPEAVKACYTRFIRSLLEVTDNRVGGKVVHPPDCVVYDGEDPYFVVAADRGTATFSDLANAIAVNEFHFWLGDAFASGGSNGYDHKKLAITSRGVWEAVCRHFREIGVDPEQQEFTVVGIGDMSGDVFGNGLLRSRKAKLLGAFDHRHIFVDPNPDPAASFEERKRLFELPQSKWSDYNPELISKGGGIFHRSEKEIQLSPEIQQALGIQQSVLSGQELIRAILRAPVDLLWNGGIGTYIKAAEEDDLAVGDRTNDDVRIDARDLRVKIVGEGGNLGFTQRGRIEYSKIGGHINTDAIDNSGGVNLSDLEVNFKILLTAPVERRELSLDERNAILTANAGEMCLKVVARNRSQSRALSLGVRRSRKNLGYVRGLLTALETQKVLDRKAENLPDDETLKHRLQLKAGLTRPELAVLLGYCKMSLFNTVVDSPLPEDPFLKKALFGYFPKTVVEKLSPDIEKHPLRREIIATEVANAVVERMGTTFVFRSAEETGSSPTTVLNAYLAADAIVGGDEITRELEVLDVPNSTRQHLTALMRLTSSVDGMSRWILDHRHDDLTLEGIVKRYREPFQLLVRETDKLTTQLERARFRDACKQLIVGGVPRELAHGVAALGYSTVYLDIIEVSILSGAEVVEVAKLISHLYLALLIRPLLEQVSEFEAADRWEESAMRTLTADLRRAMAKLALAIINQKGSASLQAMESYLETRKEIIERFHSTYQEFHGRQLNVPALLIMTNQLFALSRV